MKFLSPPTALYTIEQRFLHVAFFLVNIRLLLFVPSSFSDLYILNCYKKEDVHIVFFHLVCLSKIHGIQNLTNFVLKVRCFSSLEQQFLVLMLGTGLFRGKVKLLLSTLVDASFDSRSRKI